MANKDISQNFESTATHWIQLALITRAFGLPQDDRIRALFLRDKVAIAQLTVLSIARNQLQYVEAIAKKAKKQTRLFASGLLLLILGLTAFGVISVPPIGLSGGLFSDVICTIAGIAPFFIWACFIFFLIRVLCPLLPLMRGTLLVKLWHSASEDKVSSLHRYSLSETDALGRPRSNPASGLPLTSGGGLDMGGNPNGSRHH